MSGPTNAMLLAAVEMLNPDGLWRPHAIALEIQWAMPLFMQRGPGDPVELLEDCFYEEPVNNRAELLRSRIASLVLSYKQLNEAIGGRDDTAGIYPLPVNELQKLDDQLARLIKPPKELRDAKRVDGFMPRQHVRLAFHLKKLFHPSMRPKQIAALAAVLQYGPPRAHDRRERETQVKSLARFVTEERKRRGEL